MNQKQFLLIFFMIFVTLPFSTGCISSNEGFQEESNTRLTATPEPTEVSATLTATLVTIDVTKTKEFVPTVTPTVTLTPSLAPTPTTTPTHTSVPTMVPEEAEKLIMELINGTEDCQLPCWMDITPGQTTWYEIEPTLQAIGADIYLSDLTVSERTNPEIQIPVSERVHPRGYLDYWLTINNSKLTISEINIRRLGSFSNYDVQKILEIYGSPSEIWLNTYGYSRERDIPFRIILVYGEHNFMISYGDNAYDNTVESSGIIRGCIVPASKNDNKGIPSAFSWDPQLNYSFSDLSSRVDLGLQDQEYLTLEEATGMSVTEFYETFVGTLDFVCLETPSELWP